MEEKWLELVKRIQALAKNGLFFTPNHYDRDRYEELDQISIELLALLAQSPPQEIKSLIGNDRGYVTPKVDVRSVVIQGDEILMVKESEDGGWSLPGGYADYGYAPSEVAVKETAEETGLDVKAVRLLAVFDKKCHDHPPTIFHTYKIFILCEVLGGNLRGSNETVAVGYHSPGQLPPLSSGRITRGQIEKVFALAKSKNPTALFD